MLFITNLFEKFRGRINKYYLTIFIFFVMIGFIGDSTFYKHFQYYKKINELKSDIKIYQNKVKENKDKLNSLHMDNESLERFAREQFLMTKNDEELYIITP